jgi:endonuclease YncB( thermonuclease family)
MADLLPFVSPSARRKRRASHDKRQRSVFLAPAELRLFTLAIIAAALIGWFGHDWLTGPPSLPTPSAVDRPVAPQMTDIARSDVPRDIPAGATPGEASETSAMASGTTGGERIAVQLAECSGGHRHSCVVDGDTFWLNGEKIRIADIDTPEVSSPRCPGELALGRRATRRLTELLNAGPFELQPAGGSDRYGRTLLRVTRGGASLGDTLVGEGLAVWYGNGRPDWC